MSEVVKIFKLPQLPQPARNSLAWSIVFLLAGLAWIPTLQQTLAMLAMQMYGTMGMPLTPFLCFWTIMMAAMMLPALAPTVSVRVESMRRRNSHMMIVFVHTIAFVLGYLLTWCIFGVPIFICCLLVDHFVLYTPLVGIGLGIFLFIGAGLYQFTALKKHALFHCNPALNYQEECQIAAPADSIQLELKDGLRHGLACLQCCGLLMMVLIAVGLMNLFWMVLITFIIFIEKVWTHGDKFSVLLGFMLIFYGLLTFVAPWLLPGLYMQ